MNETRERLLNGVCVTVLASPDEVARQAADVVAALLREKPASVLGLPTGTTPIPLYAELVRRYERGELDFGQAITFNLDEYLGLGPDDPRGYAAYMRQHLWSRVSLRPERTHIFNGLAPDPEAECRRYEEAIGAAGGIDLMILGIGLNGHIGFNEPGTPFDSRARVTALADITAQAHAAAFGSADRVPRRAYTLGIANILETRRALLLATGRAKAEPVARALEGPITPDLPASALRAHPAATFVLDAAAAARLHRLEGA